MHDQIFRHLSQLCRHRPLLVGLDEIFDPNFVVARKSDQVFVALRTLERPVL